MARYDGGGGGWGGGGGSGDWGRQGQAPPPDDTIELSEVIEILRRRKWLVLLFVALGLGLGYAVHELRDPAYEASAVIRIDDPRAQMSEQLGMFSGGCGTTDPIRSALEVLKSRTVLGEIVDAEGLRLQPVNGPELPPSIFREVEIGAFALPDTLEVEFGAEGYLVHSRRSTEAHDASYGQAVTLGEVRLVVAQRPDVSTGTWAVTSRDAAIRTLERNLASSPRPETNVVDVRYTSSDPETAQRIVNRAVQVFQTRSMSEARAESERRRVFLEEQLAQADTSLQMAQAQLTEFRSQEQVVSSQAQGAAEQTGLMNIEMRREELRADRGMYASILGELAEADPGEMGERIQAIVATPEVAANPVVSSLHQQLMEYEAEREALTSGPWGLSENNPDVARIDQQIATTRGRLESAVRSHMDNLDARLAAMDDLRERTAGQISARPQSLAEEERLVQDVSSIRRTVEQLQEEFQRARLAEAIEEGPVEVVDLAPVPTDTQTAGLPLMLALGLMLGGMVGAGGAFVLEMLNTKVRHQDDVEDALQTTAIGIIPRLPNKNIKVLAARAGNGAGPTAVATRQSGRELVTVHRLKSAEAEAFRTLRTNLLFARNHDPLRTVVVSSAIPGEGKTTTASNLAVTYAQQGLQVLLVDVDLRKPRVGELFGMDRKPGFTEYVLGEAPAEECIRPFEAVEGLHIMPAGTLPQNPAELVGGARARDAIRSFRDRFDIVILDTPPLAGGADAAILGASTDGVLMVIRAGRTDMEQARQAARQLHTVGAHLIGAVVNDPSGEMQKYGRYYQYEYYGEEA